MQTLGVKAAGSRLLHVACGQSSSRQMESLLKASECAGVLRLQDVLPLHEQPSAVAKVSTKLPATVQRL